MVVITRLAKVWIAAGAALLCLAPTTALASTKPSHPAARHVNHAVSGHRTNVSVKTTAHKPARVVYRKVTAHKPVRVTYRYTAHTVHQAVHKAAPKKVSKSNVLSRSLTPAKPTPAFTPLTSLFSVPSTGNMQGVSYHNGVFYVAFDIGNGQGVIQEYSMSGQLLRDSGPLNIGHAASLSYNAADGTVLIANGGGDTPTMVYEVNMDATVPAIVKTLDFQAYGMAGLAAVDNDQNTLWLHTSSSNQGAVTFRNCDLSGNVRSQFTIPNQGIPQGLAVYKGNLYYYTDNKVIVLNPTGQVLKTLLFNQTGESEGLTVVDDATTPYLVLGYGKPNRYYLLPGVLS